MNNAEMPAVVLVSDQCINKSIGVRKMPPPTPTRPESNPIPAPMIRAIQILGGSTSLLSEANFHASRNAAKSRTKPSTILYTFVGSLIIPPMDANGIDVAANGQNMLHEK